MDYHNLIGRKYKLARGVYEVIEVEKERTLIMQNVNDRCDISTVDLSMFSLALSDGRIRAV